jgi:hypothetical protein
LIYCTFGVGAILTSVVVATGLDGTCCIFYSFVIGTYLAILALFVWKNIIQI